MGRWEPGADIRLRDAALNLFTLYGFDGVTVEQIAEAAGVTQRTFFRHFPTKEDVIFANSDLIVVDLVAALRDEPRTATPTRLLLAAMTKLGDSFESDRTALRTRAAIIQSVPALRERELLKQHHISAALVHELVRRGIARDRSSNLAGVGMVVFQVAYTTWVNDHSRASLSTRIAKGLKHLAVDLTT
jgi:AcrR family transcriptional regulator